MFHWFNSIVQSSSIWSGFTLILAFPSLLHPNFIGLSLPLTLILVFPSLIHHSIIGLSLPFTLILVFPSLIHPNIIGLSLPLILILAFYSSYPFPPFFHPNIGFLAFLPNFKYCLPSSLPPSLILTLACSSPSS